MIVTAPATTSVRLLRTRLLLIRGGAGLLTLQLLLNASAGPVAIASGRVPPTLFLAALLAPLGKLLALGAIAAVAWTAGRSPTAVRLWLLGLVAEIVASFAVRQPSDALAVLLQLLLFGGPLVLLLPDRRSLLPAAPRYQFRFARPRCSGPSAGYGSPRLRRRLSEPRLASTRRTSPSSASTWRCSARRCSRGRCPAVSSAAAGSGCSRPRQRWSLPSRSWRCRTGGPIPERSPRSCCSAARRRRRSPEPALPHPAPPGVAHGVGLRTAVEMSDQSPRAAGLGPWGAGWGGNRTLRTAHGRSGPLRDRPPDALACAFTGPAARDRPHSRVRAPSLTPCGEALVSSLTRAFTVFGHVLRVSNNSVGGGTRTGAMTAT